MQKAPDITALGEYLVNFLCAERRGILSREGHPGGAPADLLAMASPSTELLTKVGSDPFGLFLAGGQRRAPARRVRHIDAAHPAMLAVVQLDAAGALSTTKKAPFLPGPRGKKFSFLHNRHFKNCRHPETDADSFSEDHITFRRREQSRGYSRQPA